MPAGPVRVAVVEDDPVTREGLRTLIDGTPGFVCVGRFASVEECAPALDAARPDVLLLDIHLPGMLGSEAVSQLRASQPGMQVLMLTVHGSDDRILESICNGACGYILKKTPPPALLDAIRQAREGGSPMSPEIASRVVELLRKLRPPPPTEPAGLTAQETRLLGLIAEGYSYQAAGARLDISVNTVRNYIRSIYEKLQVHTRSEAVSKAIRHRILS